MQKHETQESLRTPLTYLFLLPTPCQHLIVVNSEVEIRRTHPIPASNPLGPPLGIGLCRVKTPGLHQGPDVSTAVRSSTRTLAPRRAREEMYAANRVLN